MEFVGKDPKNVHSAVHATNFDTVKDYFLKQGFSDDFHVYAVNWYLKC